MSDMDLAYFMGLSFERSARGTEGIYGDLPGQKPLQQLLPEVDLVKVGREVERAFLLSQRWSHHPLAGHYELMHVREDQLTPEEGSMVRGLLRTDVARKPSPASPFANGTHRSRAIWSANPEAIIPFECSGMFYVLQAVYLIIHGQDPDLWNRDRLKAMVGDLRDVPREMTARELEASKPLVGEIDLLNTLTPDQVPERYAAYAE